MSHTVRTDPVTNRRVRRAEDFARRRSVAFAANAFEEQQTHKPSNFESAFGSLNSELAPRGRPPTRKTPSFSDAATGLQGTRPAR
jgi:hypothetical protein